MLPPVLTSLAIANIALIEKLDLTFQRGFTALTGETGAGKSLLMDALGLALGARADAGLIRHGESTAEVAATFTPARSPELDALLEEQGLELDEGTLTLRRQLKREGAAASSRAWVNGSPVPAQVLSRLGALLVDIHAQHTQQHLLDAATQRDLLDNLAAHQLLRAEIAKSWQTWQQARQEVEAAQTALEHSRANAALLSAWQQELAALNYQPGEEDDLAHRRTRQANLAQLSAQLATATQALTAERGSLTALRTAAKAAQQAARLDDALTPLAERLSSALVEVEDLAAEFDRAANSLAAEDDLEALEDRLHALKDAARKHHVEVSRLPEVLARLTQQTSGMEELERSVAQRAQAEKTAAQNYHAQAAQLTAARRKNFAPLQGRLEQALRGLQLPHANLVIAITAQQPGPTGADAVELLLSANPGTPPQPVGKVASGGELSRLTLALKQVLYQGLPAQLVVFDEIDTGLSGQAASAVGHAIAAIGECHQVVSITHHPQVAACAAQHARIAKQVEGGRTTTHIQPLVGPSRVEELARLLAGAKVTPQARAAAQALLEESSHPTPQAVAA